MMAMGYPLRLLAVPSRLGLELTVVVINYTITEAPSTTIAAYYCWEWFVALYLYTSIINVHSRLQLVLHRHMRRWLKIELLQPLSVASSSG